MQISKLFIKAILGSDSTLFIFYFEFTPASCIFHLILQALSLDCFVANGPSQWQRRVTIPCIF